MKLTAAAIGIIIFIGFLQLSSVPLAAHASSTWWVGAQSKDSSALPNTGVSGAIEVISTAVTGCLSFWVSDTLANNEWGQVGYFICNGSTPTAFYQVWNLNTSAVVAGGSASVSTGAHTFSMYLESGTTWAYAMDGSVLGTYDMGSALTGSTDPVWALSEESASSPFSFPQVTFTTAMQVLRSGTWGNVQSATTYGNAWGVQGAAQNGLLSNDQINVGGSLGTLSGGTPLWPGSGTTTSTSQTTSFSPVTSTTTSISTTTVTSTSTQTQTTTATQTVTSATTLVSTTTPPTSTQTRTTTSTQTVTSPTTVTQTTTSVQTSTATTVSTNTVTSTKTSVSTTTQTSANTVTSTATQTVTSPTTKTTTTGATQTATSTTTLTSTTTPPTSTQTQTTTATQTVTSPSTRTQTSTTTSVKTSTVTSVSPDTVTSTVTVTSQLPPVTSTWTQTATETVTAASSEGTKAPTTVQASSVTPIGTSEGTLTEVVGSTPPATTAPESTSCSGGTQNPQACSSDPGAASVPPILQDMSLILVSAVGAGVAVVLSKRVLARYTSRDP